MDISILLHRLITGSALRGLNLIISATIAFFMLPFLLEHLGAREYGLWVIVGAILGYHSVLDFGLSTAVGRYYSKAWGQQNYIEMNNVVVSALVTYVCLGAITFSIIGITSYIIYVTHTNAEESILLVKTILIVGIGVASQFPFRVFGGILYSTARHDLLVVSDFFRLLTRSFLVFLLISKGYGLLTLALITLTTEIAANCIEYKMARTQSLFIQFKKQFIVTRTIKELFQFGWVAFITNISSMLRARLIPIIVAFTSGVEMVVIYSIALRLLEYFDQLVRTSLGITMPIFSRLEGQGHIEQMRTGYRTMLTISTILTTFIGANIIFFGEPFISMWVGDKFKLSYTILVYLTIPFVMYLTQIASDEVLFSVSKHQYSASVNILGVVSGYSLGTILSFYLPETGVALGLALGVGGFSATLPFITCKQLSITNFIEIYVVTICGTTIKILIPLTMYFYFCSFYIEPTLGSLLFFGIVESVIMLPICYLCLPNTVKRIIREKINMHVPRFKTL